MLAHVVTCVLLAASPSAAATSSSPGERPSPVELLLADLDKSARRRGGDPARARTVLSQLVERLDTAGARDRRAAARDVAELVAEAAAGDEAWRGLSFEAANALAVMGGEGFDELLGLVNGEELEQDLEVRRRLILALGRTREPAGLPRLSRLLEHHEPMLQGAAGEALGEFVTLEQERRKDVFYSLLKVLLTRWEEYARDPFDVDARWRYEVVVGPITTSLQRLSGHDERDPLEWQRFWNKHKRDDWDAGKP